MPDEAEIDGIRSGLGRRVRDLRDQRGLSMRALASAVGVTSGFISQIENGQVTPSLTTLYALSGALEVGMYELFGGVPHPERASVLRLDEREMIEPVPGLRDAQLSLDPTKQLQVALIEFDAGAVSSAEPATHGAVVEFMTVLEGELEVQVGAETFALGTGDSLTFSGSVPHRFRNRGDRDARVLWASTPASF
jgi:transcriptional regulator with XRE-family HTH domain